MGLFDLPKIDISAINSSESVNVVRSWFQEKNGFILRKDDPDIGCDFEIELLSELRATNFRFQVQLKSVVRPNIVNNNRYLSYSFDLSRLNYLLQSYPHTAIVLLYVVSEKKLYFDFIEFICRRTNIEKGIKRWSNQKSTTIHIPVDNELTDESIQFIHDYIMKCFKDHQNLYLTNAKRHNLPIFNVLTHERSFFESPDDAATALERLGLSFFQKFSLEGVYNVISKTSQKKILANKSLNILAAFCYLSTRQFEEARFYANQLQFRKDLSAKEVALLDFVILECSNVFNNEVGKNRTDILLRLKGEATLPLEKNLIELYLFNEKFSGINSFDELYRSVEEEFEKLNSCIDNLDEDHTIKTFLRHLLNLSYSVYNEELRRLYREKYLIDRFNNLVDIVKEYQIQSRLLKLYTSLNRKLMIVHQDAVLLKDERLEIQTSILMCQVLLSSELDRILHHELGEELEIRLTRKELVKFILYAAESALKLLKSIEDFNSGYESAAIAIELMCIGQHYYGNDDKYIQIPDELVGVLNRRFSQPGSSRYVFRTHCALVINHLLKDIPNDLSFLKELDEEQLFHLTNKVNVSYLLPKERLQFLLGELQAYRQFYKQYPNSNYRIKGLIEDKFIIPAYSKPVKFVLHNLSTGEVSKSFDSIDSLIESMG